MVFLICWSVWQIIDFGSWTNVIISYLNVKVKRTWRKYCSRRVYSLAESWNHNWSTCKITSYYIHLAASLELIAHLSHATFIDGLLLNMATSKDREQLLALNGNAAPPSAYKTSLGPWVLSTSPFFLWFSHFILFTSADGSTNLHQSDQAIV